MSYLDKRYALQKRSTVTLGGTLGGYPNALTNVAGYRCASLCTDLVNGIQYIAYYRNATEVSGDRFVIVGKRTLGALNWTTFLSAQEGNAGDAHNVISIGLDGEGILHVAWDMHSQPLKYWRGSAPGDISLGAPFALPIAAGSTIEDRVTYPQFFNHPSGDLFFMFRDGASASGNTVLYRWSITTHTWTMVHANLVSGQSTRSAYHHRTVVNPRTGRIHMAWTFREDSADFQSIHDWYYAYSDDAGVTWKQVNGTAQTLPITSSNAAVAWAIPQNSGLINIQGMCVDEDDYPILVGYWDPGNGITQYHAVRWDGSAWHKTQVGQETKPYTMVGDPSPSGTLMSTCLALRLGHATYVIFRNNNRDDGIWCHVCNEPTLSHWRTYKIDDRQVEHWHPTHDPPLWDALGKLHLYHQRASYINTLGAQVVAVLEVALPSAA